MTEGAARMLRAMMGLEPDRETVSAMPMAIGPTIVKISDPLEDVVAIADQLDEPGNGRRPHSWLAKQRGAGLQGARRQSPVYEGRACCFELIEQVQRILHQLRLPSEHKCPTCGTVFAVQIRVRNDQRSVIR